MTYEPSPSPDIQPEPGSAPPPTCLTAACLTQGHVYFNKMGTWEPESCRQMDEARRDDGQGDCHL